MNGAKLHSIGRQILTVALLALAAMAYLTTVVSSTQSPAEVIKPVAPDCRTATMPSPAPATHTGTSEADAPGIDPPGAGWQTPPVLLPDMVPFRGKEGDHRYDSVILRAARDYGIDPAVIKAVIMAESGFNPRAVSHAGAQGLMQLMPRTARALDVKDVLDPQANILGGARYLKRLLERFDGRLELALAAYNAGSRNVRRHNGIPPFKATHRYIAKIKIYHHHYRQQGFSLASRIAASIPPELHPFSRMSVARYLTFFSSVCRAAV